MMPMLRLLRMLLLFVVVLEGIASGCASVPPGTVLPDRTLQNLPDHFLAGTPEGTEVSEPAPGQGCRNPLVDPRDGTRLRLVRSAEGRGDYEVPPGSYGLRKGEALRLVCATGRAVAVVTR